MSKITLNWNLSHTKDKNGSPKDKIPATVPGAVQLDYAKAFNYEPYYFGMNFKQFDWMENEYFIYETELNFDLSEKEHATLYFDGIDYSYDILIDGASIYRGVGIFTPVRLDVTKYAGAAHSLKIVIDPIPKLSGEPKGRAEVKAFCKPASAYGWDWHPRLVPSGIWYDAYLEIAPIGSVDNLEASYRLTDDLSSVTVFGTVETYGAAKLTASLIAPDGEAVCEKAFESDENGCGSFDLTLENPKLWYPRGYGEQPIYLLKVEAATAKERKIGFRRTKLVKNTKGEVTENAFFQPTMETIITSPKGPIAAPMTIEINGKRVFAKGSNWVNTEIFPSLATNERYDELLMLAYNANMNILRMWGGQYINHEHFYEKCDELGIMIWQEFMLSCNLHPDSDSYLDVLKQEATTIIKRLRTHPCLTMWCGGNELFNSWSLMTCQSHPLRLLDSLCYEHDRFTPFNMTSPLHGVFHGSYIKVQFPDEELLEGNYQTGEEFICALKKNKGTAYTEFGCNGAATKEYILKYIMDEKNYLDCNVDNEIWVSHHGFKALNQPEWLGIPEVVYFFGDYKDVDDIIDKSIYLQDIAYKSMFEEMRRQAPFCSMAINWDYNEPWPCAAGNSLVSWPAEPKSCLKAVSDALRDKLLSLDMQKNRYLTGETFTGKVWMINDSDTPSEECSANVYLVTENEKKLIASVKTPKADIRSNSVGGEFEFVIAEDLPERFSISVETENTSLNSIYNFVHKIH